MAYTQGDIDALKAAIASGVKQVTFNGRSTTYHDLDAMQAALATMQAEVDGASGTARPKQRLAFQAGKGL